MSTAGRWALSLLIAIAVSASINLDDVTEDQAAQDQADDMQAAPADQAALVRQEAAEARL